MVDKQENQKDYYLYLMSSLGLKTMLTDRYIYDFNDPSNTSIFDKDAFVNHYKNVVSPTLQSAIYAVNLGDEPNDTDVATATPPKVNNFPFLAQWESFFHTSYPEKPTFNNLLPIYGCYSTNDYLYYLDKYKNLSYSPFVCFDHYPFRTNFMSSYFYNLSIVKSKFKSRSLWATVYSAVNSADDIKNPDEKQLRFMAFCPIAYGAKGIMYFPYDNFSTFTNSIDYDANKYNYIQNINLFLKNIVGPVTIGSANIATLHRANTYKNSGYNFNDSDLIVNYKGLLKDIASDSVLVGIFAKNDTTSDRKKLNVGNYYLWVVNKGNTALSNILVTLRGNYSTSGNIKLSPRAFNYVSNPNTVYTNVTGTLADSLTKFTIPALESGEGIMVQLFSSHNDPISADYDGDHIKDISIKEYDGTWLIDYSGNGFGNWDFWGTGYGDSSFHPVPADYDGDGKADISVKSNAGDWKIDYSSISGTGWDFSSNAYGNQTAHAVPADYDGDGKADLSVKTDLGTWLINYSSNGFYTGWDTTINGVGNQTFHAAPADYNGDGKADLCVKSDAGDLKIDYRSGGVYSGWDFTSTSYGNQTAHLVPADYDGDGSADISEKTDAGSWLINYSSSGFYTGWNSTFTGYGNQTTIPLPGDYGGDGKADLCVKSANGDWQIDYSYNGFGSWDSIMLTPKLNDPLYSRRPAYVQSLPDELKAVSNTSINQNKQYKIVSVYDMAGNLIKNIDRMMSINYFRTSAMLPTGIYLVKMIVDSKNHTERIFINR